MATTGYNKKGRPTWDLSADEEKRFNKMQAQRIINDESVIRSLFDDTQKKQKSITDALSVDGWTDSKSRVNLQKDIYSYQNNLAKLKSYGYDTTYQSEFGKTADKIAGARSQYYSRFKTKGDYDNFEIGERLKKNLKGATYDDIQNQIAETQDTINRLRHNGSSSKLLTENARKLNILENWTNYESVNDFEKALKNVENLQNTASSKFADANIDLQTAAGDEEYKKYSRESDAATNWMNNLKEFQAKLKKGKEDLEFSNKAHEYAKRLSGDEVRMIKEYNSIYDRTLGNATGKILSSIGSNGVSTDTTDSANDDLRRQEIKDYFKNRGIDLKTVSDIYRSEDNKKLQEINLEKIKSDMDSSKLVSAIYSLSNPLVSAESGIFSVFGNAVYGDDVKYNPYNILNKASEVITQETKQDIRDMLLKNDNLTLAPGMLNKKGEFLESLIGGAYDLYNTMAESAIARIPATVTGMSFLTDALFGINAFASTYNDMIDSGADKGKALATSALAGVFEGLFEHVSLEKLKGFQTSASVTAKDFIKNSLKQFVTEGSEELFTDFANTISDQLINGDASELNRRMQDLVASGSTYNEALTQVAKEYAAQEVDTFVIGGLSGAVSGAGYTGLAAINNAETGRNINRSGQRSALLSDAGQLADTSYDSALRAAYESVSRDEEKSRKGLGANLRTGNLYNLSRNQAYDNAVGAQKENVKKSVNNVLVSIGTDERKADILSDSLSKIATGEKLTKTEKQLVNALRNTANTITNLSADGKKTYGEIVSGNIDEMTADGIAARFVKSAGLSVKQAQNLAENIKSGNDRLALNFEYVAQMYNEGTAVDEASKAKSEKAYDTLERLDKYALGMSAKSAVVARTDEKNAKPAEIKKITNIDKHNGVMTVELSDGKDAQVSLSENNNGDVEFSNEKDAYIYTAAGTLFNTTEDANSFILASKNTDLPATDFVHEFEAVVDNAKAGEKIGKTKLPNEIAEIAYDIGLNSGKSAYRTFESGTSIKGNKDMSKLDVNNLNYGVTNMSTTRGGQSKTDMDVISRTLDAYGKKNNIKYVFVDSIKSPNGKNASGTYSAEDNVVYLSVNSKNPLSVAAGHETFHYMKRNNSKAGQELQEYIINKLKADKSYDYDARVEELSELYGTDDTDAINEEIAANSMFNIFDEATIKDLAKNHRKLFDIVREKLGEVLEYFKNAVKKYADFLGNKEARSNLKNDYEALQGIRDRMDKALEEIKNGESEKTESAAGGEKYNIEYGMSDEEREKELRKMTLAVVEYDRSKSNFTESEITALKKEHIADASKILKTLAEKFKVFKMYSNDNIDLIFEYTKRGNNKSRNEQSHVDPDFLRFAKMLSVFDDIVENAVPIEVHTDKYVGTSRENRNLKYDYVLLGGFRDGNSFVPVEFHIKEYKPQLGQNNKLYVSVTLGEIKKESELRVTAHIIPKYDRRRITNSLSAYSIADIIEKINPIYGNFLKYIPDGMLTDEQIRSKEKAIAGKKEYIDSLKATLKEKEFEEKFSLDENEDVVNKYNQVLAENKHLRELNTILREEMHKSPTDRVGSKGKRIINDVVEHIIKKYKSSADSKAVSEQVLEVLNYAKENNIDIDSVTQAVASAVKEVAEKSSLVIDDDGLEPLRKELKAYLRETPIRLTDETKEFLAEEYGSYEKFRRKYLSRIRLTNDIDASTLDTLWSEITQRFNGIFYGEDIEEDSLHQPIVLASALEQDGKLYLSDAGKTDIQGFAVDMATEIIKDYVAESATMRDKWEISKRTAIRESETALKREKQILKEEVTRTSRHVTNKGAQALDEIAKNIVKEHGIGYGVRDDTEAKRMSAELLRIYERNGNDPSVADLIDFARKIINKSEKEIDFKDGTYWERQRLRNYIKTHPITLSDELEKKYILMDNDATIFAPVIADEYSYFEPFSENGTDFVDAYKYLSVEFPSLFDKKHVKNESNMLADFRQAFYGNPGLVPESMKMREMTGGDIDDNAYKLALDIKAEYAEKSMTFADRAEKRYKDELKNRLDRLYEQKRKEQTAIRGMYERKIQSERERLGGMIEQQKDIRYDLEQRRYFRAQARKNVRAISEKLLNPTKNKFIPAELRAPVAEFLKEFTYDSLMFKNDDLDSLQRRYDAVIADNARTSFSVDDAYITDAIAQIRDLTAKLNETFGNDKRNFRKIGWTKMKAINEFVKALSHLVNNYNTVTIGGQRVDMYQTAYEMTKDLPKSRKQMASFAKLSDTYDRMIKYGNMTPYYFFKRMGGTLETLYKDLYNGEMSAAKEGLSAKQRLEGIYKAYNAKNWINDKTRRDYTTERGDKFQLTNDQRLYLYAAVRTMIEDQRIQENGEVSPIAKYDVEIPHIMQGGIVFRDDVWKERKQVGDKLKIKATYEYKDSTPIRLTASDFSNIFDEMPNEQKKFVDEIVKYMSGDLAKLGNETSVRLYGYEKFTKGYYFPIRSAQYYVRRADNSEQGQERSTSPLIKNKGMTKERKEGANNPVVVENFTDVMSSHITDMINFRYLAEPQFNMFRVMNYNAKAVEPAQAESGVKDEKTDFVTFEKPREAVNVRTSLDNAFGHETTRYIDNLIHDISSGATLDEVESVTAKTLTGFKKLATAANLSVVVQQPTAIMRAMALVDPKYFVNKISWNKSYDEAMKYAGTAILKDIGGFDMGNNRSMASWLTDFDTKVKDKIKAFSPVEVTKNENGGKNVRMSWNDEKNKSTRDDVFGYGAEKADSVTWGLIWEAVKNETRAKSNLTGEALLEEAGRRFDEVIEATQVYDSVLSRSQFMRAKSTIGKTVTAFMAEPTKTFNMLMDANYERWVKKSKGSFKYLGRATGAILASNLLNAFIRSLVTALRRDPDKSYLEQYTKEVIENFADGISIINMLPIIKDIVSIMQGEDLTRSDLEPLADMYDAVTGAFKDNADVWDKANGVLVPAGVLTGVPLRNISRDLKALLNVFNYAGKKTTSAGLKFAVNEALNGIISKKTLNIFDGAFSNDDYDKLFKYYDNGDITKAEQKYDEVKAFLIWSGKTEDKAEDAIERKIKSHIIEKYPEIVEAVSAHVNGNVGVYTDKMNAVSEKYDAELVKAVEKSVENKLKRASTAKADNDTDSYNKLVDELTEYGYDKDTLERDIDKVKSSSSSSSSDGYNGIYNKADAVRAYVSGNMTLYNQIKDEMELDEGKIKTALNELYSAGEVTDEQYTDMYIAVLAPGKTTKTVTDVDEAKKNEAFFALEAQQAKKDGEEYSKYADLNTAMDDFVSGKDTGLKVFNAEVRKLEEHGVNKSTIKGNITTQYKDKVRELYKTNRSEYVNLRAKIVAMCGQLGYSTKESVKYLDNWVKDLK